MFKKNKLKIITIVLFILLSFTGVVYASDSGNNINSMDDSDFKTVDYSENYGILSSDISFVESSENIALGIGESSEISQFNNSIMGEDFNDSNIFSISNQNLIYNPNFTLEVCDDIQGRVGDEINVTVHIFDSGMGVSDGTVTLFLDDNVYSNTVSDGICELNLTLPGKSGIFMVNITYISLNYYNYIILPILVSNISNATGYSINILSGDVVGKIDTLIPVTVQVLHDGVVLGDGVVTLELEGQGYSNNLIDGIAQLNLPLPKNSGVYKGIILYRKNGVKASLNVSVTVEEVNNFSSKTKIVVNDFKGTYGIRKFLTGRIIDENGSGVNNKTVGLNMTRLSTNESKIYYVTSDENGYFKRIIELKNGNYESWGFFNGDDYYNESKSSTAEILVILAEGGRFTQLNVGYNPSIGIMGTLYYYYDKPLENQNIELIVYNLSSNIYTTFNIITDENGEFILPMSFYGNNTIVTRFNGNLIGDIKYFKSSFNTFLSF